MRRCIVAALVSAVLAVRRKRVALNRELQEEWGAEKPARATDEDALAGIAACWRDMPKDEPHFARVDDITWSDLDMDAVFRRLNRTQSGVGEETLYRMLRCIDATDETLSKRDRWMRALTEHEQSRVALQKKLRGLGREHDHGAFSFLQNPGAAMPPHAWAYYALAAAPFLFMALGFLNPLWLLGMGASLLCNALVYYRTKQRWMRELSAIRHLAGVLHCAQAHARGIRRGHGGRHAGAANALRGA